MLELNYCSVCISISSWEEVVVSKKGDISFRLTGMSFVIKEYTVIKRQESWSTPVFISQEVEYFSPYNEGSIL